MSKPFSLRLSRHADLDGAAGSASRWQQTRLGRPGRARCAPPSASSRPRWRASMRENSWHCPIIGERRPCWKATQRASCSQASRQAAGFGWRSSLYFSPSMRTFSSIWMPGVSGDCRLRHHRRHRPGVGGGDGAAAASRRFASSSSFLQPLLQGGDIGAGAGRGGRDRSRPARQRPARSRNRRSGPNGPRAPARRRSPPPRPCAPRSWSPAGCGPWSPMCLTSAAVNGELRPSPSSATLPGCVE